MSDSHLIPPSSCGQETIGLMCYEIKRLRNVDCLPDGLINDCSSLFPAEPIIGVNLMGGRQQGKYDRFHFF